MPAFIPTTIKKKARSVARRLLEKRPVHLLHIGKTAGSAVKSALGDELDSGRFRIVPHRHNIRFRDIPKGERIIFFLRDPKSRFVSGFYSRQRQGQPRYFSPWNEGEKKAFEYFRTADQLATALSSPDREERSRAFEAMDAITHVNSHYWDWFDDPDYCQSRLGDIFFVGFQESLDRDFDNLKKKLALPAGLSLPSDTVTAHRNPKSVDTRLSDEATANLKDWYKDDYQFIDFCRQQVIEQPLPEILLRLKSVIHTLKQH